MTISRQHIKKAERKNAKGLFAIHLRLCGERLRAISRKDSKGVKHDY